MSAKKKAPSVSQPQRTSSRRRNRRNRGDQGSHDSDGTAASEDETSVILAVPNDGSPMAVAAVAQASQNADEARLTEEDFARHAAMHRVWRRVLTSAKEETAMAREKVAEVEGMKSILKQQRNEAMEAKEQIARSKDEEIERLMAQLDAARDDARGWRRKAHAAEEALAAAEASLEAARAEAAAMVGDATVAAGQPSFDLEHLISFSEVAAERTGNNSLRDAIGCLFGFATGADSGTDDEEGLAEARAFAVAVQRHVLRAPEETSADDLARGWEARMDEYRMTHAATAEELARALKTRELPGLAPAVSKKDSYMASRNTYEVLTGKVAPFDKHEMFMLIAVAAALRNGVAGQGGGSTLAFGTPIGCSIVRPKNAETGESSRLLSVGWNDVPNAAVKNLLVRTGKTGKAGRGLFKNMAYHAEANAINFYEREHGLLPPDTTFYVTEVCCEQCVMELVRVKARRVIYLLNTGKYANSFVLLDDAGIHHEEFRARDGSVDDMRFARSVTQLMQYNRLLRARNHASPQNVTYADLQAGGEGGEGGSGAI